MKESILVTGANGHLGANTIRSLLEKGYSVRAFVRKNADLRGLIDLPVEIIYGDIRDKSTVIRAAKGCRVIIHHAAVYKLWGKTVEAIMEPAIEGAKNVFQAASNAGIERVVYTSSTFAIGGTADPKKILTEKDWNEKRHIPYGYAKTKSEQLAWELSEKYKVGMIALLPGAIYGRYDYRITPSNRMILDMIKGKGMTIKNKISFIDSRDAGALHALAVEKGKIGERYILAGEAMTMKALGELVQELSGIKVSHMPLGRSMNIMMARIMETIAKLTKEEPPITVGIVREYSHRYAQYDNSKTLRDFDYQLLPAEETLRDTIRWLTFISEHKLSNKLKETFSPLPDWTTGTVGHLI